jgi:hypothetical protein
MSIIDISRNFSFFSWVFDPQIDDGQPPAVQDLLLPIGQQLEKLILFAIGSGRGKRLCFILGEVELGLLNGLLLGIELLSRQNLGLRVIALLFELPCQFNIPQVH